MIINFWDYKESNDLYDKTVKEYTKIAEVPEDQWYDQIQVNFGELTKLKYYRTKEGYFDDHKYFQVITPNGAMRYAIGGYFVYLYSTG